MENRPDEDPVLRSARREAVLIGILWLLAITYTTSYSYIFGYGRDPESLRFVLGFPDWVFWGILVPWGLCILLSGWFAFGFMKDTPIEEDEARETGGHEG